MFTTRVSKYLSLSFTLRDHLKLLSINKKKVKTIYFISLIPTISVLSSSLKTLRIRHSTRELKDEIRMNQL